MVPEPGAATTRRTRAARIDAVLPRDSMRRVVLAFVLILATLLWLLTLSAPWRGWPAVTGTTAAVAGAGARVLGFDAVVAGNLIHLPTRSLSVDPECTAVTLIAVYVALVLAYPVRWGARAVGIAAGVPVLVTANVARLVAVVAASEYLSGRAFYIVHDYLFELAMVIVVLLDWAVWLSYVRRTA